MPGRADKPFDHEFCGRKTFTFGEVATNEFTGNHLKSHSTALRKLF